MAFDQLSILCVLSLTDSQQTTIPFDVADSQLAIGRLSCPDDHHLDIISVTYFANASPCTDVKCGNASQSPSYLDGKDTVCSNENNIRRYCYGRSICEFGRDGVLATQPGKSCYFGINMMITHMKVRYRCIPPG